MKAGDTETDIGTEGDEDEDNVEEEEGEEEGMDEGLPGTTRAFTSSRTLAYEEVLE